MFKVFLFFLPSELFGFCVVFKLNEWNKNNTLKFNSFLSTMFAFFFSRWIEKLFISVWIFMLNPWGEAIQPEIQQNEEGGDEMQTPN